MTEYDCFRLNVKAGKKKKETDIDATLVPSGQCTMEHLIPHQGATQIPQHPPTQDRAKGCDFISGTTEKHIFTIKVNDAVLKPTFFFQTE